MALDNKGNYVIDVPSNGCYLKVEYPDLYTSSFFVKFISNFNEYRLHEYTTPSPYNVGFPDFFDSHSLESTFSTLPQEELYQFYNNCNVQFGEDFYSMNIDQKREYLANVGLNSSCWNEDYYYFTPNNLLFTLLSMCYIPFNFFHHNYFIFVNGAYYSLKEPNSPAMILPPPVDGKHNILINSFISRKRSRQETSPLRYELYPIEFVFDLEMLFDITTDINYDFEIDSHTMYQFLNKDTYKVFPPYLEERKNTDGSIYFIEKDSEEYILYTKYFDSFDSFYPYQDLKKLFPYNTYGFFNGFMIFAIIKNYYENYIDENGDTRSRFNYCNVTYKRILTTKYFVENNGEPGDSFEDVLSGSQTLNPNPPIKNKCCLAECFGITE